MDAEERRRILGDDIIAHIHAEVAAAPPPPPEVIEMLRRIFVPVVQRIAEEEAPSKPNPG
jgi:hypothetical protein